MFIHKNQNLKVYNTFGIEANAEGFVHITSENDVYEVIVQGLYPVKILGGGSNILLTGNVQGYILKNEIKGIEIVDEDQDEVLVKVGAGEPWHNFVLWALSHNLGGLENLALIPGSVGAAPMQNIGAYGVEQESVFHSLLAIHLETGIKKVFLKYECQFGYRESIFKHKAKNQYFITHVIYTLKKTNHHINMDYGAIKDILKAKDIIHPSIRDIAEVVMEIRKSKLPDPKFIGNAGSFFKNPVIDNMTFKALQLKYPDMPFYPQENDQVKVPAGWLIEKAGYKGKTLGNIGVHKDQALVLVNYGDGKGSDIYNLSLQIKNDIQETFGISIETEVNIW